MGYRQWRVSLYKTRHLLISITFLIVSYLHANRFCFSIARRGTCRRVVDGIGSVADGLDLTAEDYETLGLHPATLPSLTRVTTESSFWDAKRETFCKPANVSLSVHKFAAYAPERRH